MRQFKDVSIHVGTVKKIEKADAVPDEGEDIELESESVEGDDEVVGTEGLGKLWKKFKLWFTEGNRTAVENINTYYDFIVREGDEASIAKLCSEIKLDIWSKQEFIFLNGLALKILDFYGKEFMRIQKTGCFLNAYKHSVDKGFRIPECLQLISLWKPAGVEVVMDYEYEYLTIMNYKEFNKKYSGSHSKTLTKLGIAGIKDLANLVDLINNTNKFMNTFWSSTAKNMVNTKSFPMGPKGLTLSKAEYQLAHMNYYRALAIRNGSTDAFDLANDVLSMVKPIFTKLKSKI